MPSEWASAPGAAGPPRASSSCARRRSAGPPRASGSPPPPRRPRSRSRSAATAESTPPLSATSTRSPPGGPSASGSPDPAAAGERAVEGVGGEVGGVPVGRREPAELLGDAARAPIARRLQHRARPRRARRSAAAAAAGSRRSPRRRSSTPAIRPPIERQRDPDQVPAGGAARRAGEATRRARARAASGRSR